MSLTIDNWHLFFDEYQAEQISAFLGSVDSEGLAHLLAVLTTWQAADTSAADMGHDPVDLNEAIDSYSGVGYGAPQSVIDFLDAHGDLNSGQCWGLIKEIVGRID